MNEVTPSSELIRAYLNGTLDAHSEEVFELSLFNDPKLADAISAEKLLRDGLREIESRRARVVAGYSYRLFASLAVAFLALISIPTVLSPYLSGRGGEALFAKLDDASGEQKDELVIEIPADVAQLVLQFTRPQPGDVRDYTVELELPDGRRAAFEHLLPAADTLLSFGLSAGALPEGKYRARLIAIGNDGSRRDDQERHFVLRRQATAPR